MRILVFIISILFFSLLKAQISTNWYNDLNNSQLLNVNNLKLTKDSWSLYKLSPVVDSYNQMYIATGDKKYLQYSVTLINDIISNSSVSKKLKRSQFKDDFFSWENKSHEEKKNDGKEYPLFESYLWRYVTSTLVLIEKNNLKKDFNKDYYSILKFTEQNIFNKWYTRDRKNIYRENTNMSALWAHISLNLSLLSNKKIYKEVYNDFYINFEKNIQYRDNGTLFWNSFYDKKKWNLKGQDVSHANAEVSFIIDAYIWTDLVNKSFIECLILTLNNNILKNNDTTAMYLDGSGNGKGRIIDGFMKLGRFDRNLQNRLLKLKFNNPSQYHIETQFVAVLLANNKLLSINKY